MTCSARRPQGAIRLSSYRELEQFVQAFAKGQLNLLFLLGPPGVQKSRLLQEIPRPPRAPARAVRKTLETPGCW